MHLLSSIGFVFCVAYVSAASVADRFDLTPRIIGGMDAEVGQFPYQVSLRRGPKQNQHFCGGSIISDRVILSAAHCTQGWAAIPTNVFAVVGAWHINNDGTTMNISKIVNNKGFARETMLNDISLLLTTESITFSEYVKPIALPIENLPENGDYPVLLSGWGRVTYPTVPGKLPLPTNLQYKQTKTLSLSKCSLSFKGMPMLKNIHNTVVCTASLVKKGACYGDSGGPLVSTGDAKVLVAIVSWGIPCAKGYPDVFTRVYSHMDWIKKEMANFNQTLH